MAQVLWFLLPAATIISHLLLVAAASADDHMVAPAQPPLPAPRLDCPLKCGDVDIPYPYGIGEGCSWRGKFSLECNHSFNPPRPYEGDFEVLGISLETGEISILTIVSSQCSSINTTTSIATTFKLREQLLISTARNEFTVTGCNTLAFLESSRYYTGCITSCISLDAAAQDGDECAGLGCCQMSIRGNLSDIMVSWGVQRGNIREWNPCSYAFVAEKNWYKFQREDLVKFSRNIGDRTDVTGVPLVLDWAIRDDGPCEDASACVSANSHCVNASQGPGYLCNCSEGYSGNPYVNGGCTNINECELRKSDPARYEKLYPCARRSTCYDTLGNYTCKCKFGRRGDGKSDTGCEPIFPEYAIALVAIFISAVLACVVIMLLQRRKQRKHFSKNGGDILKGEFAISIFTERELKKITKGYKKLIGEGYFSKVYLGTVKVDGDQEQQVAVKCSVAKRVARRRQKMLQREASRQEQEKLWKDGFVGEFKSQIRIRHQNVVRLIGCCLEQDIPVLVSEFVPKGSLDDVLHRASGGVPCALKLPQRLDIAIGAAEALSCMHDGKHNHVHGDVKPANILLDSDLKPKVSDFGSSKLLSIHSYATGVVADRAYADPVYFKTDRFTTKSDVYSFGVVLLELITRKKARYGDKILTVEFEESYKGSDKGRDLYDTEIISDDGNAQCHGCMECLDKVGALAVRCLNGNADERPTMVDVVQELTKVRSSIACGHHHAPIYTADESGKHA
ncbi:hypothetical protein BS78_K196500 [Paspalum vaginatum]|uniref:Protein kinase domain-containing protein n=1 Tax=Paspalum vaginatum TaxID=158149 RepID=A0A9W7XBW5_9POAL|nr:hypothetical protein BS78_K196500 [Paspalum vaginatum]